ncbi:MAG: beta-ketoacyl-ACP synthase II [Negativicutes bacterium]|nr:beta-ketoacyl-ACP synthase II [Negativicutes bacterium]
MKRVVITGLGALTPIGQSVAEFWQNLIAGVNGIDFITHFDTTASKFKLAGEIKAFDPLIHLEKAEVRKTDLFVQYALYAAAEAMEDSGLAGQIDPAELAVYFGSGIGGFNTFCQEHQQLLEYGAKKVSSMMIPKMIVNIAAGQLAIRYRATGACVSVCTACATGTTAIGEAYRAILHGYATAALCGGSEAAITPLAVAGFGNCQALNPSENREEASLPFDRRRGGFVIAEGAGVLILEDYEHALARKAKIYAEIVGYGSTCDAYHVTAPDPEAGASAKAISDARKGLQDLPASALYFNAHGTGTVLNDSTETTAIKKAFGEEAKELHISSSKSMTGHMLGAAGAVEAIAAILALKTGIIPPTINLQQPDPACDLNYTANHAVRADLSGALSNSLGFGGHNACVAFRKWCPA